MTTAVAPPFNHRRNGKGGRGLPLRRSDFAVSGLGGFPSTNRRLRSASDRGAAARTTAGSRRRSDVIRIGPRRGLATVEEERRLSEKQLWLNVCFDMRPMRGADLDSLDLTRFEREFVYAATLPEIRDQNGRSTTQKLRALRLLTPNEEPTAAAILLAWDRSAAVPSRRLPPVPSGRRTKLGR